MRRRRVAVFLLGAGCALVAVSCGHEPAAPVTSPDTVAGVSSSSDATAHTASQYPANDLGLGSPYGAATSTGVAAFNEPPDAGFATTPAAQPPDPGDLFWNPDLDGRIVGRSPLDVTFNMCRSTDPDAGDALKFTYDFDGDGTVDLRGPCRATHTYEAETLVTERGSCQLPDAPTTICVSDRQPEDGHKVCREYVVCATGGPAVCTHSIAGTASSGSSATRSKSRRFQVTITSTFASRA